jgi:hypothetical protein
LFQYHPILGKLTVSHILYQKLSSPAGVCVCVGGPPLSGKLTCQWDSDRAQRAAPAARAGGQHSAKVPARAAASLAPARAAALLAPAGRPWPGLGL